MGLEPVWRVEFSGRMRTWGEARRREILERSFVSGLEKRRSERLVRRGVGF